MQCSSEADWSRAVREHRHRPYGWSGSLLHTTATDHSLRSTSLKASRDAGDVARRMLEDLARNPNCRAGARAEPGLWGQRQQELPHCGEPQGPRGQITLTSGPPTLKKAMHRGTPAP